MRRKAKIEYGIVGAQKMLGCTKNTWVHIYRIHLRAIKSCFIKIISEINCFDYPVGVSSPAIIPDNQMTASSYTTTNHSSCRAHNGRLNDTRGDGWCSEVPDSNNDWLQIDFNRKIQVCAVATQGDVSGNQWVTDFKLSYSSVGNVWTTYKDVKGADQVTCRYLISDHEVGRLH